MKPAVSEVSIAVTVNGTTTRHTVEPRLTLADIPQAMRLKESAGWNQTALDWQRLLTLAPDGCWGIFDGETLASFSNDGGAGNVLGLLVFVAVGVFLWWDARRATEAEGQGPQISL